MTLFAWARLSVSYSVQRTAASQKAVCTVAKLLHTYRTFQLRAVGLAAVTFVLNIPFRPSVSTLRLVAGAAVHVQLADADWFLARRAVPHADHLCFLASRSCRTFCILNDCQPAIAHALPRLCSQLDRNCTKSEGMDTQSGLADAASGCIVRSYQQDDISESTAASEGRLSAASGTSFRSCRTVQSRVGRGELITFKELPSQPIIVVRACWFVVHLGELFLHPAGRRLGQQIAPVSTGCMPPS